jgi:hypothetical protein
MGTAIRTPAKNRRMPSAAQPQLKRFCPENTRNTRKRDRAQLRESFYLDSLLITNAVRGWGWKMNSADFPLRSLGCL